MAAGAGSVASCGGSSGVACSHGAAIASASAAHSMSSRLVPACGRGTSAWHKRRRWRWARKLRGACAPVLQHHLRAASFPDEIPHRGQGHLRLQHRAVAENLHAALIRDCLGARGRNARQRSSLPARRRDLCGYAGQWCRAPIDADPIHHAIATCSSLIVAATAQAKRTPAPAVRHRRAGTAAVSTETTSGAVAA